MASLLAAALVASAPEALAAEVGAGTDLYLEVSVNAEPTDLVAHFRMLPDGTLATTADELRAVGVAPPAGTAPTAWISLNDVAGLTYAYRVASQTIAIALPADALVAHRYDASKPGAYGPVKPGGSTGALLNYTLVGTIDPMGEVGVAAGFEARAYRDGLVVTQTGIVETLPGAAGVSWHRLDSTVTYDDPDRMVTARAGDLISGGLTWSRPLRLGGFQISRNFSLRQDLVTLPLPAFSGTAAVPSTIDITANGAAIFSGALPAGPFMIANLPVPTGGGTARVVVTDALGRKVETDLPIFASNALLAPHLVDFSLEAGVPRIGYGDASDTYAMEPALSGSLRVGVTPRLTLEGHAEAGRGLVVAGGGAVFPVAGLGIASLALMGSLGDHAGAAANTELTLACRGIALRLRSFHTFGDYADLANVYTERAAGTDGAPFAGLARASDQVSLSMPVSDRASGSLSFTRIEPDFGETSALVGASLTHRISTSSSLSVSAFHALAGDLGSGVYVGLSRAFGNGAAGTVGTNGIDLARSESSSGGSAGWRFYASDLDHDANWLASFSKRFAAAHVAASVYGSGSSAGGSIETSGAIVLDHGVFLANRIDNAFAVVNAGAPGVTVYLENRPVGRSDASGRVLVTDLNPHVRNRLSIDPDDLPAGAEAGETEATVVPLGKTGVAVRLAPAKTNNAALLSLRDRVGNVLAPGLVGTTEAGAEFVVGYGGEAYVTGLASRNRLRVTLDDGSTCSTEFSYVPAPVGTQPVRDVICQ